MAGLNILLNKVLINIDKIHLNLGEMPGKFIMSIYAEFRPRESLGLFCVYFFCLRMLVYRILITITAMSRLALTSVRKWAPSIILDS